MTYERESAETAYRVLDKCTEGLKPDGPWRWQCVVQNGARLPIAASVEEGFLQLTCRPGATRDSAPGMSAALSANNGFAGGVKLALDPSGSRFLLRTDIVILEEKPLLDRLEWALDGFHECHSLLQSSGPRKHTVAAHTVASGGSLGGILHECAWPCTERGPNDFSAELDADSAPPATIRRWGNGVRIAVELVRSPKAPVRLQALAVYLLTVAGTLRLVRTCAMDVGEQKSFALQVGLPHTPAAEEIEHALAALSIAYRLCVREANLLLHDAAARCYLEARGATITNEHT